MGFHTSTACQKRREWRGKERHVTFSLCGFVSLVKPFHPLVSIGGNTFCEGKLLGMAFPQVSKARGLEGRCVTSLVVLHKSTFPRTHNTEVAEVRNSKGGRHQQTWPSWEGNDIYVSVYSVVKGNYKGFSLDLRS